MGVLLVKGGDPQQVLGVSCSRRPVTTRRLTHEAGPFPFFQGVELGGLPIIVYSRSTTSLSLQTHHQSTKHQAHDPTHPRPTPFRTEKAPTKTIRPFTSTHRRKGREAAKCTSGALFFFGSNRLPPPSAHRTRRVVPRTEGSELRFDQVAPLLVDAGRLYCGPRHGGDLRTLRSGVPVARRIPERRWGPKREGEPKEEAVVSEYTEH